MEVAKERVIFLPILSLPVFHHYLCINRGLISSNVYKRKYLYLLSLLLVSTCVNVKAKSEQ